MKKQKRMPGYILLATGAVLLLAGLLYEGLHYPWGALFGRESVPMPPAPISDTWITESVAADTPDELPGEDPEGDTADPETVMQAGVIQIPRLNAADNIVEGVDQPALRLGVGHWPGTALPGQPGNCVLAGHRPRDLLRHLELVAEGDTILLSDQDNVYTYQVFQNITVEPTALWITEPVEGRSVVMTLFTCTPYMVSTHRMVVQAELVETEPRV